MRPGVMCLPRPGPQRHLMAGNEQDARVVFDQGLRAVAVMHIEIDDGDAGQPVVIQRMFRPDGDVAEQAKAHCSVCFGMMTGRADGSKGILHLARQNHIDSPDHGPGGTVGSGKAARRHMRIGIKCDPASRGGGLADRLHIAARMDAQQVTLGGQWRIHPQQVDSGQRAQHCIQPRDLFRVARRCDVVQTFGMGDECCCHAPKEQK